MKKISLNECCQMLGGGRQDTRAGIVCGGAIVLAVGVGLVSGGIGFVAMMGGAAGPACAIAAGSLYYPR